MSEDMRSIKMASTSTPQKAAKPKDRNGEPPVKKWASPASWDRYRARITHLYTTEGKTLNEVMAIMAAEQGHHATTRMYKSRIATWGLMKYKKEDDMLFVLRKKTRRDALGKATSFSVRGREVSHQDIVEYFARKGGLPDARKLELDKEEPSTPKHISYHSPPPSPQPSVTLSPFTLSPAISRQPTPPQYHYSSEELFFTINAYFDGSFGNADWISDPTGNCVNRIAGVSKVTELEELFSTAQTAGELIKGRLFVEARRILSRTCNMIHVLLADLNEDPRSLEAILQILLHLRHLGLTEVIKILQSYIVGVAGTLKPPGQQERIWVKVCRMIGQLEPSQLEDAIGLAWRCTNDGFERNLGALHETTLLCYIDYIVWIHGMADHVTEEKLLREVWARAMTAYPHYSEIILTIMSRITESIYEQGRLPEAEILAMEIIERSRQAGENVQLLLVLELACLAQYDMKKFDVAERNLREGIAICMRMNSAHPWIIKNQAKLEGWLREWGRHEEADALKTEVNMLIGRDDIDAEMNDIRDADM